METGHVTGPQPQHDHSARRPALTPAAESTLEPTVAARGALALETGSGAPVAGSTLRALQRSAGNAAVASAMRLRSPQPLRRPPVAVQRDPTTPAPATGKSVDDLTKLTIQDFAAVPEQERMADLTTILDAASLPPMGQYPVLDIWRSFGSTLPDVRDRNRGLWDRSVAKFGGDENAALRLMPFGFTTSKTDEYVAALKAMAGDNLTKNATFVDERMQAFGLKPGSGKVMDAAEITKLRVAMQGLAWNVWSMRESQRKLKEQPIGTRALIPEWWEVPFAALGMTGQQVPVAFDPKQPPREPDLKVVWDELKTQWDQAQKAISKAAGDYPEIYELVVNDEDDKLLALSRAVPEAYGTQQQALLQSLADRIHKVQDQVTGGEIDLLEFRPMMARMAAGGGPWSTGFNGYFAELVSKKHEKEPSTAKQIAELGGMATVMLAPFATTGIGTALEAVAVAVTVAATAIDYKQAAAQAEVARATPVAGTELVDRAVADEAKAQAEAHLIEAAVLAVVTAVAAGAAVGPKLVEAIQVARLKSVVTDQALLDRLIALVSDKSQLYRLVAKVGDSTRLEKLLGTFKNPAELEALLAKAGDGARLEELLAQVPDGARLASLLDSAGSGDRLSLMIKRIGNIDEVAAELAAQARGESLGLKGDAALKRVAESVSGLRDRWAAMTPDQRLAAARAEVNAELQTQGVPPIQVDKIESATKEGEFSSKAWGCKVNEELLAADADPEKLTSTLVHEARHAEQTFTAARVQAGKKVPLETLMDPAEWGGLNLDEQVAREAINRPLSAETSQGQLGQDMASANRTFMGADKRYKAITDRRDQAFNAKENATLAVREAKQKMGRETGDFDGWNPEIRAAKDRERAAEAAFDIADKAYRNVPFEKDAFEVQAEFEAHLAAAER